MEKSLAAPCGVYCGACRHYLLKKKELLEKRGYKQGCDGCRLRNKNCVFIRKDCQKLRRSELEFCYECESFPCVNLQKLSNYYENKYFVNMIKNLKRIKDVGVKAWLIEQESLYTCAQCGGEICIHDKECLDCGIKINLNKIIN